MKLYLPAVVAALACSLCGCASDVTSAIAPGAIQVSIAGQQGLPVSTPLRDSAIPGPIPGGFVGFCRRNADQCQTVPHGPTMIALTAANFAQISDINRTINQDIKPEDDSRHYGVAEYWTIPTDGYGDCEDYALAKRKALADAGFPVGALRLALVVTADRERHAVLTLVTNRGDFILDNLTDAVRPWTEASYTWLERQDPGKLWRWDMLTNSGIAQDIATSKN